MQWKPLICALGADNSQAIMNVAVGGQSKWAHYACIMHVYTYGIGSSQHPALSTSFFSRYSNSHLGMWERLSEILSVTTSSFSTDLPLDCVCY